MGLLEINGTLDVKQFWPDGKSDADTTKVILKVGPGAFTFNGKQTKAFAAAFIATKPVITKKGTVTIRLQGIDAPELHYRPTYQDSKKKKYTKAERTAIKKVNAEFRQKLAETGTMAVGNLLKGASGLTEVPCVVRTRVKKPNDVFDKFGRVVGDVYVTVGGTEVDLNHWVLEQGWALPALYNSMENDEINRVLAMAKVAEQDDRGVWGFPLKDVRKFDFKLVYRNKGKPNPAKDRGAASFAKVFRRVASWRVLGKAGFANGTFQEYLKAHPDDCYRTDEFTKHRKGWKADKKYLRKLSDFVTAKGEFRSRPGGLVFVESESTLKDKDGNKITKW
jgi:endonuclease YncB( thermonuclease family)